MEQNNHFSTDIPRGGTPVNSPTKRAKGRSTYRDVDAWIFGMFFIVVFLCAMNILGDLRGWDANSGWDHNTSKTSPDRFLPEPFVEEVGVPGRYGVDAASRWYYWKLPPDRVTSLTRGITWLCYVLHQLFMWGCIYYAQRVKNRYPNPDDTRYSSNMKRFNWIPLIGNGIFHLVHLGQTHWTYDALAQDVSEGSSQGSVSMLLVFVLVIEYRDRGMFFGWPSRNRTGQMKDKQPQERNTQGPQDLIRRYHGYAFSWAAIFTFWYHPMENTLGHFIGFTHTWMFMLQGSLMYTHFHLNRYWRFLLEVWVCLHGTLVAIQTGGPSLDGTLLYPMFLFGFLWLLTMTQLFGLPAIKSLPRWTHFLPFLIYMGIGVYAFGWCFVDGRGRYWVRMNEMVRIPVLEYLSALIAWCFLWLLLWIERKFSYRRTAETLRPPSILKEVFYISGVVFTYAILVAISIYVQVMDIQIGLVPLLVIFINVFGVGVCVACMMLKQILDPIALAQKQK